MPSYAYPSITSNPNWATSLGGDWETPGAAPLGSRQTAPNTTTWNPSAGGSVGDVAGEGFGGGGGGVGKQYDWSKIIGTAGTLAGSLLAPEGTDVKGPIKEAQGAARDLAASSKAVGAQGATALSPVLQYLSAVSSGDPSALLQATMPERRRVIDQYDTAKQATQFAPRGGGTSSAFVDLNAREASDLAMIGGKAKSDALKMGADIGTNLTGAGLQGENAAAGHMANLLNPIMAQSHHDEQSTFQTFASIAALAAMFI